MKTIKSELPPKENQNNPRLALWLLVLLALIPSLLGLMMW